MDQKPPSQLTDQELIEEAKHSKPSPLIDAFFIGFLIGIVIYSFVVSSWGFLTLIPLFMVYLFLKKPKRHDALVAEMKARGLSRP